MDAVRNGDVNKCYGLKIYKNCKTDVCVEFIITREKPIFNVFISTSFVFLLSIAIGLHYWTNFLRELKCIENSKLCFVFSLVIVVLLGVKTMMFVEKETLLVIFPVGIQFTTTYAFGSEKVMFIPWSDIKDALIVEVITGQKVLYYLALSIIKSHASDNIKSHEGLFTLFQNTRPRLNCLQEIYQVIHKMLNL